MYVRAAQLHKYANFGVALNMLVQVCGSDVYNACMYRACMSVLHRFRNMKYANFCVISIMMQVCLCV